MRRLLLGAALLMFACEGAATLPAPSTPTPVGSVMPTGPIDVSDMMGGLPPATFYLVASDGVRALALLNHYTRYTIPTEGEVQVAASGDGKLFVADEQGSATRLRAFEMSTGIERASRRENGRRLHATGIGHGALAVDAGTGALVALFESGGRRVAEAFDEATLQPRGRRIDADCGDRLLVGGARVAVACFERGVVRIVEGDGLPFTWDPNLGGVIAAAMLPGGAVLVGRSDGALARLAPNSRETERLAPYHDAPSFLVPDGLAAADATTFVAALYTGGSKIGVSAVGNRAGVIHLELPRGERLVGGIVTRWPFAYWVNAAKEARHVDLAQGFAETMASMVATPKVLPGAVGDR